MPFMLLIAEEFGQREARTPEEGEAAYGRMVEFAEDLKRRGVLRGVESLKHVAEGARVRVREGRAHVVDGPFSEAREMIGGFFVVDVPTRDEAIALARECPAAAWCTIEVRETGPCFA